MLRASVVIGVLLLPAAFGQFKSYKNNEEYCRDNPKMPTCINKGPIDFSSITNPGYYDPNKKSTPSRGATQHRTTQSQPAQISLPAQVALQDWRFSHPTPAMLI